MAPAASAAAAHVAARGRALKAIAAAKLARMRQATGVVVHGVPQIPMARLDQPVATTKLSVPNTAPHRPKPSTGCANFPTKKAQRP